MDQEATAQEQPGEALLWRTNEAAAKTSLSRTTLNRLADEGRLTRYRVPGHNIVRWSPPELLTLLSSFAEAAPDPVTTALEPKELSSPEPIPEEVQTGVSTADGHARTRRRAARIGARPRPSSRRPGRVMTWAEYRETERNGKARSR